VLCLCFLLRSPARAIQTSLAHQAVAVCAFYSGAFFVGQPLTESLLLLRLSWWLTLLALIIGLLALWHLGKSFGVLIAVRELRTGGLYGLVRHPMYLSDIVFRVAYLASHPSAATGGLFLASTACYVIRARLEESFWAAQNPAYGDYMQRVRYRFIPGLF
jgi:protein-S-isoprenylcysteine O-methyltransferase Ste14